MELIESIKLQKEEVFTSKGENVKIEENTYPLSNVLRPLNSAKTVAQMNKDENNQYYLQYSEKKIKEVFK